MRIHKTDPAYCAARAHGCKDWREIMAMVKERAIERAELLAERNTWNGIQNAAQESWE